MTASKLREIARRHQAAHPGPYRTEGSSYDEDCNELPRPYNLVATDGTTLWCSGSGEYAHPDDATASFLAASWEDVAQLLQHAETAHQTIRACAGPCSRPARTWQDDGVTLTRCGSCAQCVATAWLSSHAGHVQPGA